MSAPVSTPAGINPNPRNHTDHILNWQRLAVWLIRNDGTGAMGFDENGSIAVATLAPIVIEGGKVTIANFNSANFLAGPVVGAATKPAPRRIHALDLASEPTATYVLTAVNNTSMNWTPITTLTPNFSTGELPTGTIDGVNGTFTLAHAPLVNSEAIYKAGLRLKRTTDYTVTGSTLTMTAAPAGGSVLQADYRY
jgi:hypothetical protein